MNLVKLAFALGKVLPFLEKNVPMVTKETLKGTADKIKNIPWFHNVEPYLYRSIGGGAVGAGVGALTSSEDNTGNGALYGGLAGASLAPLTKMLSNRIWSGKHWHLPTEIDRFGDQQFQMFKKFKDIGMELPKDLNNRMTAKRILDMPIAEATAGGLAGYYGTKKEKPWYERIFS